MDMDVFRYTPDRRADLEPGLAQFGMGKDMPGADDYFNSLLTDPDNRDHAVFVARDSAGSLGMANLMRRPMFGGAGRMAVFFMPQDDEAKVIPFGQALLDAVVAYGHEHAITRIGISVRDDQHLVQKFLDSTDMTSVTEHHAMAWEGEAIAIDVKQTEGVSLEVYEGGSPQINVSIATLWEWAFRRDPLLPGLTPETIEDSVARDGIWFVIARTEDDGRVVGISEAGPGSFFSGIAVARSHWGTNLAEGLAAATMNEFIIRGQTSLHSMVRKTNRASVALHERMDWKITSGGNIYATAEPGKAPS